MTNTDQQGSVSKSGEVFSNPKDLETFLQSSTLGADLQISAFYAALAHYRRASVATPFPSSLFRNRDGSKDYQSCLAALKGLPPVMDISARTLVTKQPTVFALLCWLLLPSNRRRISLHSIASSSFFEQLSNNNADVILPSFTSVSDTPSHIFRFQRDRNGHEECDVCNFKQPAIAYHGTTTEALHSILNSGLLNFSNTRMQRNGAAFGNGIYLSTRYEVALAFSKPANTWPLSELGVKARCLLVCEVDMSKLDVANMDTSTKKTPETSTATAINKEGLQGSSRSNCRVPEGYLVVSRPDAIKLLYVCMYSDAPVGLQARDRNKLSWSVAVVVVYVVALLLNWLAKHPDIKRVLRHAWNNRHSERGPTLRMN